MVILLHKNQLTEILKNLKGLIFEYRNYNFFSLFSFQFLLNKRKSKTEVVASVVSA